MKITFKSESLQKNWDCIPNLEENWDGYGACEMPKETITCAYNFIKSIPEKYFDLIYYLTPSSHGTIVIEWYLDISNKDFFVEVEIGCNGSGWWCMLPNNKEPYNDNLILEKGIFPQEILLALEELYK